MRSKPFDFPLNSWTVLALAILMSLTNSNASAQTRLGTNFTYQGLLKDAGGPVTGQVDIVFKLYANATLGGFIGTPVVFDGQAGNGAPIDTIDGLFAAELDFGANFLDGTALWLEIAVRSPHDPTDTGAYTTLNPRQPITAVPYALALRGLRTEEGDGINPNCWNVIGGYRDNFVDTGVSGATIAGGGESGPFGPNRVFDQFGTVSGGSGHKAGSYATVGGGSQNDALGDHSTIAGGFSNVAAAAYSMVPGGAENRATGEASFAAGFFAGAIHNGTFVWADYVPVDFNSTGINQFLIRATGGVGIGTNAPTDPLTVAGVIRSTTGGFELPDGTIIDAAGDFGDITAVNAGNGLSGGGTSGSVTLNVQYSGSGTSTSAARGDHYHSILSSSVGSAVVHVDGNNVGIGTPIPNASLDIRGTLAIGDPTPGSALWVNQSDQVGIGGVLNPSATLDVGGSLEVDETTLVVDDVNDRVGIGTASPNAALTVNALGLADAGFEIERDELTYADTKCRMGISGGSGGSFGLRVRMSSNDGADWTESMFFDEVGNVGISTTAPQAKLHVGEGDNSGEIRIGLNPHLAMDREVAANKFRIQIAGTNFGGRYLQLGRDDGNHDVVVTGNLGIGTSSPTAALDVVGSMQVDGSTFNVVSSTNRVGIGTTNPSQALHVVGNACATGTVGACSDGRFKKDVAEIKDSLETINQLHGVHFNWRRGEFPDHQFSDERQIGFIAQEIAEVLPEVVSQGDDGYYMVAYGRLTPVIVEAIKQLQQEKDGQIETLERKNAELEARLNRLEAGLANLNGGAQ